MSALIPANIVIGDRTYRLKIEQGDEETVRKTIKLINEKIVEFKTNFAGRDMQDYIAMVIVWYATEQIKQGREILFNKSAVEKLDSIEALLNKEFPEM